jgi:GT2 family glycosyltransferase
MIEVVIPVHNRCVITLRCLELLAKQTNVEFAVTVVDDGSSDGTSKAIREKFPTVDVLQGDGSLWWAGATNLGIRHVLQRDAATSYILILNDDVEFDSDYLACMERQALANPDCLIGSLAVYGEDPARVFWCGEAASYRQCRYGYINRDDLSGCVSAVALPGRGMLVPTAVFKDIDLFDNKAFPQYAADFDFSLRARKAGYKLLCCCDTAVIVSTSKTGPGSVYRSDRIGVFLRSFWNVRSPNYLPALWRFWTRHYGVIRFAGHLSKVLAGDFLRRTNLRKSHLQTFDKI